MARPSTTETTSERPRTLRLRATRGPRRTRPGRGPCFGPCFGPSLGPNLGHCLGAALVLGVGLSALLAPAAEAGPKRCGERARIVAHLGEKYGEVRRSVGLQAGRGIVELFANAESGSWTLLLTSPRGITCLMAAGSSFRAVEPGPPGAPA